MKKIKKIQHTCEICKQPITLAECAFNETLCYECQWKENQKMLYIIYELLKNKNL